MQNLRVNKETNLTLTYALHQCAKGLFGCYLFFDQFCKWLDTIYSGSYTILGGFIEGMLYNKEIAKKVKEDNELRRKAMYRVILDDLIALARFTDEQGSSGNATPERLRSIEKYPLYLRKFLAKNINAVASLSNDSTESQANLLETRRAFTHSEMSEFLRSLTPEQIDQEPEQEHNEAKQKLFKGIRDLGHRYKTPNVDRISRDILIKLLEIENNQFFSHEALQKFLFNFGTTIGQAFQPSFTVTNNNNVKTLLELILLLGVYCTLYLSKNVILKPFEIFKCLVLGTIAGVHKDILRDNPEIALMLIDLEHPIDELTFAFKSHYESIAYRNDDNSIYTSGKKCPMKTIEKLITVRSEFLIRKLKNPGLDIPGLKTAAAADPTLQYDIGATISRDNPAILFFAAISTIDDIVNKLAVTIGHTVGEKLGSFCSYVRGVEPQTPPVIMPY